MGEKPKSQMSLLPVGTLTESSPLNGCAVRNTFYPVSFSMRLIYLYSHGPGVTVHGVPVLVKDDLKVVRG